MSPSLRCLTEALEFLPLIFLMKFQILFIGVLDVNFETNDLHEVRLACLQVRLALARKTRSLARLSVVGCLLNLEWALFRSCIALSQSSVYHGLLGCFGIVEVLGIVSSAIDNIFSLKAKIGSSLFIKSSSFNSRQVTLL